MIGISISIIVTSWPKFFTDHLWIMWISTSIGLLLVIIGFFMPKKNRRNLIQSVDAGNLVAGDNTGIQINRSNIIGDDALDKLLKTNSPRPTQSFSQSSKTTDIIPHLESNFQLINIIYNLGNSLWRETTQFEYDGKDAIVAWFNNPVPPKGSNGLNASQLSAHIKFSVAGQWSTEISRGYWLGYSENEITIDIGHKAGLILGMVDWTNWISYINPYTHSASEEFLQPACRNYGEMKRMPKTEMEIDVSLLSHGTTTIDQLKLLLTFPGGRPYVARIL